MLYVGYKWKRILKAHPHSLHSQSHSMRGGSIWAFLECHCCFWIAGGWVYSVRYDTNPPAIQKEHWHSREAQIEPPLIE